MPAKRDALSTIRNIGIISHIDAGKTTVTERILYYTGISHKMGEVHNGQAIMDWMPLEQEKGITITAAATTCNWKGHTIQILDTPGHVDFTIEVERSLRVLDGAVAIFCAVGGVQPQSEAVWHQADQYHVPRLAFVNKMDRVGADFFGVLEEMGKKLSGIPLPLQLPLGSEATFSGVVDLVELQGYQWQDSDLGVTYYPVPIPATLEGEVNRHREHLLEVLAEEEERFLEMYLNGEAIPADRLRPAIRRATLSGRVVPVLCGAALRNKGIQLLLDAVVHYLPSPTDVPPVVGYHPGSGEREDRPPSSEAPFAALAFKVITDQGRRLTYFRIYSGKIAADAQIYNASRRQRERISKLLRMHANKRERLETAQAGQIVAATGLKETCTGDTLSDERSPIVLETIPVPTPVISVAVEPKTLADQERLAAAIDKLLAEDPTLDRRVDGDTGQTIISGMGELHLEIFIRRLQQDFGVAVGVGQPQVVYRETITQPARVEGHFAREVGGVMQTAHLSLALEPLRSGSGLLFTASLPAEQLPQPYLKAVEQAIREAAQNGPVASYPLIDLHVDLCGATYEEGRSTELAFTIAASQAFREGCQKGAPVLLEPIMSVEVVVPEEYVGPVNDDLNSRRGRIEGNVARARVQVITARVPLSQLFGYATALRSASQGRATYTMQFSHYARLPSPRPTP